jgi:hypothetical protein
LFVGFLGLFKLQWLYCAVQLLLGSLSLIQKRFPYAQENDLQIRKKGLEQGLKWPISIFFIDILTLEVETAMLVKMLGISHPVTGLKSNKMGDHRCTVAKA